MSFEKIEISDYNCGAEQIIDHMISVCEGKGTAHLDCSKTMKLLKNQFSEFSGRGGQLFTKENETKVAGRPKSTRRKSVANVPKITTNSNCNSSSTNPSKTTSFKSTTRQLTPYRLIKKSDIISKNDLDLITSQQKSKNEIYQNNLLVSDDIRLCDFVKRDVPLSEIEKIWNKPDTSSSCSPDTPLRKLGQNSDEKTVHKNEEGDEKPVMVQLKPINVEHFQSNTIEAFEIGLLFWQIVIRQKLFQTKNDKKMFQCLVKDFVKPEIDVRVPKKLRKMILSCWESQIEPSSSHKLQAEFVEKLKDMKNDPDFMQHLQDYLNYLDGNFVIENHEKERILVNFQPMTISSAIYNRRSVVYLVVLVVVLCLIMGYSLFFTQEAV